MKILSAGLVDQIRKILAVVDRRKRWLLALLTAATIVVSMLEVVSVTAIFPLLKLLLDPQRVNLPEWLRQSIAGYEPNRLVLLAGAGLFAIFAVKVVLSILTVWFKGYMQARLYRDISVRLFIAYLSAPLAFHFKHNSADLQRNLNPYVAQLIQFGCLGLIDLTSDVLLTLGIFVALFWIEPTVSALVVGGFVVVSVAYLGFGQGHFLAWSRGFKRATSRMYQMASESVAGIKTIKVLGRESFFTDQYRRSVSDYCEALRKNSLVAALPRQVLELCAVGTLVGIVAWVVLAGHDAKTAIPMLAVFAASAFRLMPAFVRIMNSLQNLRFGHDAIETVYSDLTRLASEQRRCDARRAVERGFTGDIVIRDASFSYAGAMCPTLADVNVEIRAGEAVALVGPSGAGKTTLADLILGLHKLDRGTLMIDGVQYDDPAEIPRGVFGYVPQDPFLVDDTIVRNIALGVPDPEIDQAKVSKALGAAALDAFVAGLPDGLQTIVGDRGVRLSGGQRQRIGIARALYGNPKFLVLDEATSSVDATTEAEITEAINRLRGVKTVIVVAHRLSTVRECDRIVLLDKGRIVDEGGYQELVKRNKSFATMVANLDRQKLQPQSMD